MARFISIYIVFLTCIGCAKSVTVTASLNNSPWFGSGEITEVHMKENETCLIDRFSITIRTDLPFNEQGSESNQKIDGCIGNCIPTQWLGIYQIPLKRGTYNLALPDTCLPIKTAKLSQSFSVTRSSLLLINSQTGNTHSSYKFLEEDKGWVKVTKLNRTSGKIQGRFELTLTSSSRQTVHFKAGKFSGKLVSH